MTNKVSGKIEELKVALKEEVIALLNKQLLDFDKFAKTVCTLREDHMCTLFSQATVEYIKQYRKLINEPSATRE